MSRSLGVMEVLQDLLPEWAITVSTALSWLGDLVFIAPILALLYFGSVATSLRRGKTERLCPDRTASLIAVVFGGLALVVLLKGVFAFPRPPTEFHAVEASEYGFPSGHTMAATIFWGALAMWASVGSRFTRGSVVVVIVSLVAVSRLALGVHFLLDVVASVAFGGLYLIVVAWITRWRPGRAFLIAIGVAILGMIVTNGSSRAILALLGTIGASGGWWVVERPSVRGRIHDRYTRLIGQ